MSTSTVPLPQSRRPSRRCREPAVCISVETLSPVASGQFHREHLSSAFETSKPNMYRDSSFSSSDLESGWPLTPPLDEEAEAQHIDESSEDHDEDYGVGCSWADYGLPKSLHRTSSNDSFQCRGLGMFNISFDSNNKKPSTLEAAATASTATKPSTSTLANTAFAEAIDHLSSPIAFSNLKLDSAATVNTKRRRSTLSRLRNFPAATGNPEVDGEDRENPASTYKDRVQPGSAARRMSDFTNEADQRASPTKKRPSTPVRPARPETLVWNSAFADTFPATRRPSARQDINEDIDEEGDGHSYEPCEARDGCSPLSTITRAPRLSWLSNNRSRHTFPLDLTFAVNTFSPRGQAGKDASRLPRTLAVHRNDSISSIKQRLSSALKRAGLPTPAEELIVSLRSSEVAPQVSPRIRLNSIVDYEAAATPPAQTGLAARKGSAPLPSPSYTTLLWAAAARRRASATPAMTFCSSSSPRRSKRSSLTPTAAAVAAGSRKDSLSIGTDAAALTARWRELDDDEATLDHVGVTPSDQLVVALRRAHYVHF